MDISILATAINCVVQDLKDRSFITGVKKQLDELSEDEKKEQDVREVIILLADVVNKNIIEKQECLFEISSRNFTDGLRSLLDDTTKYSKSFKADFLTKISGAKIVTVIKPRCEELLTYINNIELGTGKNVTNNLYKLYDTIDNLQKTSYKMRTQSASGNIVIIDPIANSTHNTMGPVLEELKQSVSNKIKTIDCIDNMVGGGFAPKSLNIFGALPANGKSLTLQNILMYASKNNSVDLFELDPGLSPCLLFVSLELTKKQCFQRQLAWCGVNITDEELLGMTESDLSTLAITQAQKEGLQIPIVYIERIQGTVSTSILDIESECQNLMNTGFQPVMIAIDYIDRMDTASGKHKSLIMVGAEGSALLRQKGMECKELAVAKNCPVITAAQLNGEAYGELGKVEAFMRQVDILYHYNRGMLAGSKQLQNELDTLIFQHKIEIENKTQEGQIIQNTSFVAFSVMKDRDGHAIYRISERDRQSEIQYKKYTQNLKNSVLGEFIKETSNVHCVVPLDGFRLDPSDYAKSIRMFYPSDKSEFVSLSDVLSTYGSTTVVGDNGLYDAGEPINLLDQLANM